MIVRCPSCATRNQLSPRQASGLAGTQCQDCGYHWTEVETLQAIDVTELPLRNLPRVIAHEDHAPEFEARRLAEMAKDAKAQFAAARQAKNRRLRNWAIYIGFVSAPFLAAALAPEAMVAAAPISLKAYEKLGYDINVFGLDIRRVERQHAIIDGKRILTIKGELSNVSADTRKLPWLRFALLGPSGEELYTWTLDTGARPLRAGETTGFVTRVAAPPEAAANLVIRFARSDEIGTDGAKLVPVITAP